MDEKDRKTIVDAANQVGEAVNQLARSMGDFAREVQMVRGMLDGYAYRYFEGTPIEKPRYKRIADKIYAVCYRRIHSRREKR